MRRRTTMPLLLLLMLTGCAPQTEQATPTAAPVTISVLYGESTTDPGLEDIFTQHIAGRFPGVRLEWESVDWGERFSSVLQMKIAAGEVPDIIIGKAQDVYAFKPTGILAGLSRELTSHVQSFGLDSVTLDGASYGLPYNMLYQGVLYNKNIFRRYGLDVPQTPDELREVVETLEAAGITPFGTHFQETWYTGNILMQFAANEVFSKVPDWGDRLRARSASFSYNPAWQYCYEQAKYVLDHSWTDALSIAQSEADLRFANEECAMYLTGSWSIQTLLTVAPQRDLGIFPYPNQSGDAALLFEPNITFMLSAKSENLPLLEDILLSIITDQELSGTILSFTQTDTMLSGVTVDTLSIIRQDIDRYKADGRVFDVTIGNSQLVWSYQYACAEHTLLWLKGQETLEAAFAYADQHRMESGDASR